MLMEPQSVNSPTKPTTEKPNDANKSAEYDPFNPDDSPDDEQSPKIIEKVKFEIKTSSAKLAKPVESFEVDKTQDDQKPKESGSGSVKTEPQADQPEKPIIKKEANDTIGLTDKTEVKVPLKDVKTESVDERKTEATRSNGDTNSSRKDYKKDYKNSEKSSEVKSAKKQRSRSPHGKKESRTPNSKSKSPKRDKNTTKTGSRSARRSRSNSKSRRRSRSNKLV